MPVLQVDLDNFQLISRLLSLRFGKGQNNLQPKLCSRGNWKTLAEQLLFFHAQTAVLETIVLNQGICSQFHLNKNKLFATYSINYFSSHNLPHFFWLVDINMLSTFDIIFLYSSVLNLQLSIAEKSLCSHFKKRKTHGQCAGIRQHKSIFLQQLQHNTRSRLDINIHARRTVKKC